MICVRRLRHLPRQRAGWCRRQYRDSFRPCGIFGRPPFRPANREELVKNRRSSYREIFIVQFPHCTGMRQRQL